MELCVHFGKSWGKSYLSISIRAESKDQKKEGKDFLWLFRNSSKMPWRFSSLLIKLLYPGVVSTLNNLHAHHASLLDVFGKITKILFYSTHSNIIFAYLQRSIHTSSCVLWLITFIFISCWLYTMLFCTPNNKHLDIITSMRLHGGWNIERKKAKERDE